MVIETRHNRLRSISAGVGTLWLPGLFARIARIQPTTKNRIDLALRLKGHKSGGRLQPSKIHETTPLQIGLSSVDDVDSDVLHWLQEAYEQNR